MAHALQGYNGKCKAIHGHTYGLSVTFLGEVISDPAAPDCGFVIDFNEISSFIKEQVINHYDHALVLRKDSVYLKSDIAQINEGRFIITNFQPSCENLLIDIKQRIEPFLKDSNVRLIAIRLRETPTSYAEWHLSDDLIF